jgi:DNA (cytosine-5)-methyltransferase 1
MIDKERPKGVDLYCGVGGMSLGFEQAGFDIVAAVDSDPIHIETYSENFPATRAICADLTSLSGAELRSRAELGQQRIDVLFGGPPCGGFSLMGKRQRDDSRNRLLLHFARLVVELNPRYFVVENVGGLLIAPMTEILAKFLERVRPDYSVVEPIQVLEASDYGVPQARRRVFILGYRSSLAPPEYPVPYSNRDRDGAEQPPTVWDAIGDLSDVGEFQEWLDGDVYCGELGRAESRYAKILRGEVRDDEDFSYERVGKSDCLTGCARVRHTSETVRRFASTLPGTAERVSRFHRLHRNGLCPTLRAGSDKSRGSFTAPRPIHPVHSRCITVREGARLHSFPDWFQFHPTKWHGFRQVGNSVPPLLARAIARPVREVLGVQVASNGGS